MLLFALAACGTGKVPLGGSAEGAPVEDVAVACSAAAAVRVNEVVSGNLHGATDADGDTSDWIELLLPADAAPTDLVGWVLTDDDGDGWTLPAVALEPGDLALVWASGKDRADAELHADFALDALGDTVRLLAPDGCEADRVELDPVRRDVSLGRTDDGDLAYFLEPTPGAANTTESRPGFATPPTFSPEPGVYAEPVTVSATAEGDIVYTLDGSVPTDASEPWTGPLPLEATPSVVRAVALEDGLWPSDVATGTWFADATLLENGVKLMSLVVDPPDLWDDEIGIYVPGLDYEPNYPYFGANFWELWEKDLHLEVWDTDGTPLVRQDAGIQIAGGYSRAFDQRNFELLARGAYGADRFDAPLFPDEEIEAFQKLYLRNGGDWCGTQIVDGTVQALFRDSTGARYAAVDAQAYTPVLVWLNGEFWGVYELKERLDENWIADHRGEDPDALDRVKLGWTHQANWELEQGSWDAFDELDALAANDLSDPTYWAAFEAQVDLENFASSVVAQGWIGNTDWWGNNLRMWRPHRDDGRWRWMVYDFGHGWADWRYDHLATSVSDSWTGLPIGAALANPAFHDLFVNVHADYLNTTLSGASARATVEALAEEVRPVMALQRARWCGGATMSAWEAAILYAEQFAEARAAVIDADLIEHLGLSGHAALSLVADPPDAGTFRLAVVEVPSGFSGTYYLGVPVTVTAVPAEGWELEGWSDGETDATRTLPMAGDTEVTATFVGG